MLRRIYKTSTRLRRLVRRTKNAIIGGLAATALWLVGRLSLEQALRVGEGIGVILYHVLRGARRLTDEHLKVAFGEGLNQRAREHLARAVFINIARCFCELAKIDEIRTRAADYIEVAGLEHLQDALGRGTGVI